MKILKNISIAFVVFSIAILLFISIRTPSNNRVWSADQQLLPYAEFRGNDVTIRNIRNFTYRSTTDFTPAYYDKTFDLADLSSVDFIVEPFKQKGAAHTFLSFGFKNIDYVAISAEIRKEKGETFSPLKGLFREYELMYVIADERDAVKLRSNYRIDPVYIYPAKISPESRKQLFINMLNRANKLREEPEFYNTLTNTCTTNIVSHINAIKPSRVPFDLRVLLPKDSDALALELGLIDTNLSLEEVRKMFLINEKALKHANDPDFSQKIRKVE